MIEAEKVTRPTHADVANAIGAATAQIGGESEKLVSFQQQSREDALAEVTGTAQRRAIEAGADASSLKVVEIDEVSMSYSSDQCVRMRVKVVGDIDHRAPEASG